MVTPGCVLFVPTSTAMGTALPAVTPAGITTFTWITPATRSCALPAYCTVAGRPATVAVTGNTGPAEGPVPGCPSAPGGLVWPAPVTYSDTTLPIFTGRAAPLTDPSWFTAAACPLPELFRVKIPGTAVATLAVSGAENCPLYPAETCTC